MKLLNRLRYRGPRPLAPDANAPQDGNGPIEGYDGLKDKEVVDRLRDLSQVELEAVDGYEQSHRARPAVIDKLRYMRTSEPLERYDTLAPDEIARALKGADAERVKAVRDYERKFQNRREVLDETARVLPESPESARETRSREEKSARVSASTRSTGSQPPA